MERSDQRTYIYTSAGWEFHPADDEAERYADNVDRELELREIVRLARLVR